MRRTPLAWEVRKTSPCRTWSTPYHLPKSGSPASPVEQTIVENRVIDNKNEVGSGKGESNVAKNMKMIKESKNQGSKNDGKSFVFELN